jgi:hypothetical protein
VVRRVGGVAQVVEWGLKFKSQYHQKKKKRITIRRIGGMAQAVNMWSGKASLTRWQLSKSWKRWEKSHVTIWKK